MAESYGLALPVCDENCCCGVPGAPRGGSPAWSAVPAPPPCLGAADYVISATLSSMAIHGNPSPSSRRARRNSH